MTHQCALKHHNLVNQYNIVNQCLQLIHKSKIKKVMKLRIETKLIRIKRLLLNDVLDRATCGSSGEDVLEGLLSHMRTISRGCDEESVADFLQRIKGVVRALGGDYLTH